MTLLRLEHLMVSIEGRAVLADVTLALEAGRTLGLAGESGSGKSLTAMAVMGLLPPGAQLRGAILLDGQPLTSAGEPAMRRIRGRKIGIVFQEPMTALNPLMNIGDQIAEGLRAHARLSRAQALRLAGGVLERVGLPAGRFAPTRYPHELSGGQRQRVAIAIAIGSNPELLIADEPTTALDVSTQAQILELLRTLVRETGMALMLISHDLALIANAADSIAIMQQGRIVERGATAQVLRAPLHPHTRELVLSAAAARFTFARRAAPPQPLLEVRDLICEYSGSGGMRGDRRPAFRAVDGVSLSIAAGERVGLVGESGSGKTTLLRALLAVSPIRSGDVRLAGESLLRSRGEALRALRRKFQCVFQDPAGSFDPRWRVERLIGEPLHLLHGAPRGRERRVLIEAALERVGLSPNDADRFAHEFSGGERQRIAIARALIVAPAIVAFDEATSALDAATRRQILALLAGLSESLSLALLFVTHDLGLVRSITDTVLIMQHGRIVESGPTQAVFDAPRHPYTAALLAASLHID